MNNNCPFNHNLDGCFLTGLECEYLNKDNCEDYLDFRPHPTQLHHYQQSNNPDYIPDVGGAILKCLDDLDGVV